MDDSDLPIVDPHHHFWDLARNPHPWLQDAPPPAFRYGDTAVLRRDFLPADYDRAVAGHNVVATVTVEAEWDPRDPLGESRWISLLHARSGRPAAHVGQAWLDRDDVAEVLAGQAGFPLLRGVRHKPRAAPSPAAVQRGSPGSMSDPRWRAGYALLARHGLHFELQAPWWHLEEAAELIEAHPDVTLVLNHTGLPADRSEEGLAGWRAAMRRLARCPQAMVKISGLGLRDRPYRLEDNRPVILDTIEIFGPERCMFASNFPVDGLCASFDTIYAGFKAATAAMPAAERLALFHDNAVRIYRLSLAPAVG